MLLCVLVFDGVSVVVCTHTSQCLTSNGDMHVSYHTYKHAHSHCYTDKRLLTQKRHNHTRMHISRTLAQTAARE